jgi:glycerophosphoryl diester phosphodiesterase
MNSRPLLLGHRGCRGHRYRVHENTIEAFDVALKQGCDGFEFDVRLTSDGAAVICHNDKFGKTIISKVSAGQLPALPLLEKVFEKYADIAFLDIELKVPGLEFCLLSALSQYPPGRGYVVSSFLPEVLTDLRQRSDSIPLGIICETRRQLASWPSLPIQFVIAKQSLVTPRLIGEIHDHGEKIFVWTVNRKSSMLRLARWGIDGIISDKADLLCTTVQREC